MARNFLAAIVGIFVSMLVNGGLVFANGLFYPLPESLPPIPDLTDPAQVQILGEFIAGLPLQALLVVLLAHGLGSLLGAMTAARISGRMGPALAVGVVSLIGGISNLMQIPHPLWFGIADLALYVPLAYFGALPFVRDLPADDADDDEKADPDSGDDKDES